MIFVKTIPQKYPRPGFFGPVRERVFSSSSSFHFPRTHTRTTKFSFLLLLHPEICKTIGATPVAMAAGGGGGGGEAERGEDGILVKYPSTLTNVGLWHAHM